MSDTLAIQVDSLSKTYKEGWFGKKYQALNGVSFNVQRGEIFGLLGPNGAGKTTFIKILLGIIRKSGGSASMLGHPAGSRAGRQLVGYLPEHLRIPPHMTGYTALECYGNLSNIPTSVVRQKRGELLELVGLETRGADRVKKYSKGMLQRLGLAQALLHEPQLLILDEPTDGLDPRARAEMRQVIRELKAKGVTIFLNSHILQEVEMICDRVAILHRGHLKYSGLVDEINQFVTTLIGSPMEQVVELQLAATNGTPINQASLSEAVGEKVPAIENPDGVQTVRVKAKDQTALDELVDRLRARQFSIVGLSRQKVTLEDAFLKIVEDN